MQIIYLIKMLKRSKLVYFFKWYQNVSSLQHAKKADHVKSSTSTSTDYLCIFSFLDGT